MNSPDLKLAARSVGGSRLHIHPFAVVEPGARIGPDVHIGPFAYIGDDVVIEDGCRIMTRATILSGVRLGEGCEVHPGAVLGGEPQNRAFRPPNTEVDIGPRTVLREGVTVSRATKPGHPTRIGADCLLMAGSHVGHDCVVGDGVTMANGCQVGGHCHIGDAAVLGGMCAVHQFVRIGRLAMVGGSFGLTQDAPPFMLTSSPSPGSVYGVNRVGLQRRGIDAGIQRDIKQAHRILFRSRLNVTQALDRIRGEMRSPEIDELVTFFETSARGVCAGSLRRRQTDRSARGGSDFAP
jgi:UDP-N-acetylglucosamine acyltransferase